MTVAELIEKLRHVPQDAVVVTMCRDEFFEPSIKSGKREPWEPKEYLTGDYPNFVPVAMPDTFVYVY